MHKEHGIVIDARRFLLEASSMQVAETHYLEVAGLNPAPAINYIKALANLGSDFSC